MVNFLCSDAGKAPCRENLIHCTLEHFAYRTAPELQLFVAARHPAIKNKSAASRLKKPRGAKALEDARNGIENLRMMFA